MADIINPYSKKQQLSEGVYVMEDGNRSWGGEVNHNFELLNSILAKKTLTLTYDGHVLGTYDARLDSTIDIPVPSIEIVNHTLTLKKNGTEIGKFDNSEDTDINIQNYSLGIKYGEELIGSFDNTEDLVIEIPKQVFEAGTLTLTLNGEEVGKFKANEEKTLDIVLDFATNEDIDNIFN